MQLANGNYTSDKFETPCHIIDLNKLIKNLNKINKLRLNSDCMVLQSLKGLSNPYLMKIVSNYTDGISAGSLYEAKLAKEILTQANKIKDQVIQIYNPAYKESEFAEIIDITNMVIFNSYNQYNKYTVESRLKHNSVGLRINIKEDFGRNVIDTPLGIDIDDIDYDIIEKIDGLHIHVLCEHDHNSLRFLLNQLEVKLSNKLDKLFWLNLGGGHLIGSDEYNINEAIKYIRNFGLKHKLKMIIEPSEGIYYNTGDFCTTVLDIIGDKVILDMSPVCHMPDAVYNKWKREINLGSIDSKFSYKLYGQTCYSKDTFGIYKFDKELKIGDVITFKDTATYNWVKNSMFNGVQFPNIYLRENDKYTLLRKATYDDYKSII